MDFDERIDRPKAHQQGWERRPPPSGKGGCGKFILAGVVLALVALPFTPIGKKRIQETFRPPPIVKERIVVKEVPAPPPPLPDKFVPNKLINLAELFNGFQLKNEIEVKPGEFASKERLDPGSYTVSFQVYIRVPKPSTTLEELSVLNAALPKILPRLPQIMQTAKVSGFFHHLYEVKEKDIQIDITRLDKILSRHNYYDLETVLELEDPMSKQKALLIQGEMDVVSDGSDGDRMATFDDYVFKSSFFQPSTSYAWPKLTKTPNPLLPKFEAQLAEAREKAKSGTKEEQKSAKSRVESLPAIIAELKKKSFLISQEDPFVVIPLSMKSYKGFNDYAPGLGDYAVVIAGDQLLPAIIGDFGPREKMGEASLRICKQINEKANSNTRPESDLKITYLIFPDSAEKSPSQPNLAKWTQRCQELIDRMGGVGAGYSLLAWKDRFQTPPVIEPVPGTPPTPPPAVTPPVPAVAPNPPPAPAPK